MRTSRSSRRDRPAWEFELLSSSRLRPSRRRKPERLRLGSGVFGLESRGELAITNEDSGQDETEQKGAEGNGAGQPYRLKHDVAQSGDLILLYDRDHDRR